MEKIGIRSCWNQNRIRCYENHLFCIYHFYLPHFSHLLFSSSKDLKEHTLLNISIILKRLSEMVILKNGCYFSRNPEIQSEVAKKSSHKEMKRVIFILFILKSFHLTSYIILYNPIKIIVMSLNCYDLAIDYHFFTFYISAFSWHLSWHRENPSSFPASNWIFKNPCYILMSIEVCIIIIFLRELRLLNKDLHYLLFKLKYFRSIF